MLSFSELFLALGLLLSWKWTAFAALIDGSHDPNEKSTGLVERQSPPVATFDVAGWPNIAEENCFAMLCLMKARTELTRVDTSNAPQVNGRASGAALTPFQDNQLATRHTEQISPDTISAGEFPWGSLKEGGENAYVFPVTNVEQRAQAGGISTGYANAGLSYGDALQIRFTNSAGPLGAYCTALFSNPPDQSVCIKQPTQTLFGVTSVNIADFAFQIVKAVTPYTFVHVAGSKKGTKRSEDLVSTALDAVHDAHLATW